MLCASLCLFTFQKQEAFLSLVLDLLLHAIVLELVLVGHFEHAVHLFQVHIFSQRKQAKAFPRSVDKII